MNTQKWNPAKAFEISGSYWQSCILHAAVKLGVFQAIDNANLNTQQIAAELSTDKRATEMFLNALVAIGLLEKRKHSFSNTYFSKTFLSKKSKEYIGHIIMHQHHLVESWARLDRSIKKGKPLRMMPSYSSVKELRESFLLGMFNLAMGVAPQLVKKIDLSKRRHLLDLGGGPGTYAIHFCLRNPKLKATVFDLPTTRPFAESTIRRFHLSSRINFVGGDYLRHKIKGSYDVAFFSHILHGEGPGDCQKMIKKAVSALAPGGMIIVHDFILKNTMDGPVFPAIFSLNMLLGTKSGQSYSEEQIKNMLAHAKVKQIKRVSFKGINDSGIITGVVKG